VIRDIFGDIMFRRKNKINRKWSLNTKVCIYTTLILIGVGMFFFTLFEWNGSLKNMTWGESMVMSFLQSATTRTSGFNSMDFGVMNIPTLIIFIILMFIGASPVSTGGGIKTTTISVLVLQAINTVKGKNRLNLSHQEIPQSVIFRSMTILLFSLCFVVAGTIILTFTQPGVDIINLVFEQVSAFATTGLSTGITPQLTTASKVVIIISMFCGRIGMLTFGFALIRSIKQEPDMIYPKASILV
jgi:Trk-type K+ transport system membrane component